MGAIYQGEGPYQDYEGTLYFKHLEVGTRRAAFVVESRSPDEGNWELRGMASRESESGPFRSGRLRYVCLDDGDLGHKTRLIIWIVPTLYERGCVVKGYFNDFEDEPGHEPDPWHFEFELERQGWQQPTGRGKDLTFNKITTSLGHQKSKKVPKPSNGNWQRFFRRDNAPSRTEVFHSDELEHSPQHENKTQTFIGTLLALILLVAAPFAVALIIARVGSFILAAIRHKTG